MLFRASVRGRFVPFLRHRVGNLVARDADHGCRRDFHGSLHLCRSATRSMSVPMPAVPQWAMTGDSGVPTCLRSARISSRLRSRALAILYRYCAEDRTRMRIFEKAGRKRNADCWVGRGWREALPPHLESIGLGPSGAPHPFKE